jgi:lipoprotein-releasing system ATP-binding protein
VNNACVLELNHISKSYREGAAKLDVLKDVNLQIAKGEMVALIGPSGSGKTTLLQIAGLLDNAGGGEIKLLGETISEANDATRTQLRREKLGFVYQFHHLLPEFSALDNVAMPLIIQGVKTADVNAQARTMLEKVGLSARMSHLPSELSGGEQQRVAIARALVTKPALLIADEPTGNLDPDTSGGVFELLITLCKQYELSVLMATHNMELANKLHRIVRLQHGVLV